jgi:hypothetical protein
MMRQLDWKPRLLSSCSSRSCLVVSLFPYTSIYYLFGVDNIKIICNNKRFISADDAETILVVFVTSSVSAEVPI